MRPISCIYAFLIPFVLLSQGGMNTALRLRLHQRVGIFETQNILVKGDIAKLSARSQEFGIRINYHFDDIASVQCQLIQVPVLLNEKLIDYAEFIEPRKKPLNDTMIYRNRIKSVKLWTAPLPQAYNGEGMLLGFVDTGIDFNHPDFKDSLGQSRIEYIWDQKQNSGSAIPVPFNYGIEWRRGQIDSGFCTHNDIPNYGHGTHVAGIAAGNGLASNSHEGIASKAAIVMVALNFNNSGPTIADGVKYILDKAAQLSMPCVINVSVGDYYGSHDATDLEAKLIENIIAGIPGRALVAAVGNAGNIKYHVKTKPKGDTLFTWVKNPSAQFYHTCYGDSNSVKTLSFSIGANRLNFSNLGRISFRPYDYAMQGVKEDTLFKNGNRIGIISSAASINAYGTYELAFQITPDTLGLYWRIETAGIGEHDAWNFDVVSNGIPGQILYPDIVRYARPDTASSMVTGFQCSEEVITVSNYNNLSSFYDVNGILRYTGETGGELALNSSKGPTRDGRQKPDIAATGHGVLSALPLTIISGLLANTPSVVAQGSMHVLSGGSSAASPVVAGLAALYIQRFPQATNRDVRNALRNCAYRDSSTGSNVPDYNWGFGKLDGKATMYCGETLYNSIRETASFNGLGVFPNPFHEGVTITFGRMISGPISVYSSDGRLIFTDQVQGDEYQLRSENLPVQARGLLFAVIISGEEYHTFKLIRE